MTIKMKIFKRTLLLTLVCASVCFGQTNLSKAEKVNNESFLLNIILKCLKTKDLGNCLKLKAVHFLNKLVGMKEPLVITEYLSLAKDPKISDSYYRELTESGKISVENSLNSEEKNKNLDKLIWDKLVSLFTTRTIQLSLPSEMFEGRGKEDKIFKKGHGFFLMTAMMGSMMVKMALGKIALIAGKALIIGKIALILSLLIALRRFAINGGGQPEVVFTSSELANRRNFKSDPDWAERGSDLAYAAHKPEILHKF